MHVAETATDKVANTSPTAASVSTDLYGMAALDACEQITERLRPIAAQLPPGTPFASLVTVGSRGGRYISFFGHMIYRGTVTM